MDVTAEAEDADDGEILPVVVDDDGDLLEGDFFAMGGSCFCGAFRLLELASTLTPLLPRLLKRPQPPPLPLLPAAVAEVAPIEASDGEGIVQQKYDR